MTTKTNMFRGHRLVDGSVGHDWRFGRCPYCEEVVLEVCPQCGATRWLSQTHTRGEPCPKELADRGGLEN